MDVWNTKMVPKSSSKFLPGFIMKLDDLKNLGQFYCRYCVKKSDTTGNIKRKSSTANVDLDKIINVHKPKILRVSFDF